MEVEPGFPCPKCARDTQLFYGSNTGDRVAWSCPNCRARGWFKHDHDVEKTVLIEE